MDLKKIVERGQEKRIVRRLAGITADAETGK
jgi:hypothetical protein